MQPCPYLPEAAAALAAHDKHLAEQGLVVVPSKITEKMEAVISEFKMMGGGQFTICGADLAQTGMWQAMLTAYGQE